MRWVRTLGMLIATLSLVVATSMPVSPYPVSGADHYYASATWVGSELREVEQGLSRKGRLGSLVRSVPVDV